MPAPRGLPAFPSRGRSTLLLARLLGAGRGFARARSGAGAVELALLAVPFLLLLCVVVEAAMMTLSQQTLDSAVDRATRALRTGAFQDAADGNDPAGRLRQVMCGRAAVLFRCQDLRLDVTRGSSFGAVRLMAMAGEAANAARMAAAEMRLNMDVAPSGHSGAAAPCRAFAALCPRGSSAGFREG